MKQQQTYSKLTGKIIGHAGAFCPLMTRSNRSGRDGWVFWQASEECSRRGVSDFPFTDRIRGYWNKPRNGTAAVEIDLVAWNDKEHRVRFGSCKRNAGSHNPQALDGFRNHVERFLATRKGQRFRAWRRELVLYAPQFSEDQRRDLEQDGWLCRDLMDFQQMLGADGSGQLGALAPSPKITGER